MSLRSRFVERAMREVIEELPERPAVLEERLTAPRAPETAALLRVFAVLRDVPLGLGPDVQRLVNRLLEDTALLCEYGTPEGEAQRVWARGYLDRLHDALAAEVQTTSYDVAGEEAVPE